MALAVRQKPHLLWVLAASHDIFRRRMKNAAIIQHVSFEDLGSLAPALAAAGYQTQYLQAGVDSFDSADLVRAELLVVLGGPIGIYETDTYPWLLDELSLLRRRLNAGAPTLGICLGAQLLCAALGGEVKPGGNGKEIGWSAIEPIDPRESSRLLGPLFESDVRVLHWHGDTYSLPRDAVHLARTARYEQQAFSYSDHVLALQFHPEVQTRQLERWYIGHTSELNHAGISIPRLRADGLEFGPRLESAAEKLWQRLLAALGGDSRTTA